MVGRYSWLPLPAFVVGIAALVALRLDFVWNPPLLIPALNIFFGGTCSVLVFVLATRIYLTNPSWTVLFFGCGMLAAGLGVLAGAVSIVAFDLKANVTIVTGMMCLSGFLNAAAAIFGLSPMSARRPRGGREAFVSYFAVLGLFVLLLVFLRLRLWPEPYDSLTGLMPVGKAGYLVAAALVSVAAIILAKNRGQAESRFRYWYAKGLGLVAIGLFGLSLQGVIGDAVNWGGRCALYAGTSYLVVAVISSRRRGGKWVLPFERALQESEQRFRQLAAERVRAEHAYREELEARNEQLRLSNEALVTTLRHLRALVDNLPGGILLVGEDRIEMANRTFCEYYGLRESPSDLVGLSAAELIAKIKGAYLFPEEAVDRIREIVAERKPVIGEELTLRGDRSFLRDFIPIERGGVAIGRLWYHAEITERKKAELELEDARTQAELYLDLMGHDISNLHQIMLVQLELAQEYIAAHGALDGGHRGFIDVPVETLEKAAKLIENVRNLQRLKMGGYHFQRMDLGRMLKEVLAMYSRIPGRDISLRYSPGGDYFVEANPILKDVFTNLMDNAVKHTESSLEIGVEVSCVDLRGVPNYCVAIEDDGCGIPDAKKAEVFQRLKRGGTMAKGTGLGLYLVKCLVEGFKGHVEVHDRVPGDSTKGARFLVFLPAAPNASAAAV